MSNPAPRRNWFFALLIPASVLFVATALAVAVMPALENQAMDAGAAVPPSAFRTALREDGVWWLLGEVIVVVGLSIAAMVFDDRGTSSQIPPTT
ncbi:MAG: hypothetical protein K1X57_09405 [Gemmataceae bacterium]|nr:hypothetical protein [Gemmataceae bacterium]